MSRGLRRRVIAAIFVVTTVLTVEPAFAGEHLRSQVHEHLWYYWPTRAVYYYVQDTGGSGLNVGPGAPLGADGIGEAAARSFSAWASQPCTDLQFFYAGLVSGRDSNMTAEEVNDKNTIIFRGDDWVGTDCLDAIACTTVVTRRAAGEIIDADIDLNAEEHDFVLDPVEGSPAFDLQSVLTHEIGHLIGFDHATDQLAVMWPYASWGDEATRRALAEDDVAILCDTYAAGECTKINDYDQLVCPETVLNGGCAVAASPEEPDRRDPPSSRDMLWPAGVVLAVAALRRRFRSR